MKAEGGMAAATVLHKVKVKEETKECCGYQQSSSTCSTPSGSSGIATVTGSSASTHASTVTTLSNGGGNDTGSDNGSGNAVSSHPAVAAPSTTTALPNASPASSAVVCHPSTPAPSHLANADPFPVDLDLKTKAKGASYILLFFFFPLFFDPSEKNETQPRTRTFYGRENVARLSYAHEEEH